MGTAGQRKRQRERERAREREREEESETVLPIRDLGDSTVTLKRYLRILFPVAAWKKPQLLTQWLEFGESPMINHASV